MSRYIYLILHTEQINWGDSDPFVEHYVDNLSPLQHKYLCFDFHNWYQATQLDGLKKYKMVKTEPCFGSWVTFHYFEIVCLVHYNQEHQPHWKKSDYFNKGLKECQPVRHPIKMLMDKGKAFFYKHVLTLIPKVKITRGGVQCAARTEKLNRRISKFALL